MIDGVQIQMDNPIDNLNQLRIGIVGAVALLVYLLLSGWIYYLYSFTLFSGLPIDYVYWSQVFSVTNRASILCATLFSVGFFNFFR